MAAQSQSLRTKVIKAKIDKTKEDSLNADYAKKVMKLSAILSECSKFSTVGIQATT